MNFILIFIHSFQNYLLPLVFITYVFLILFYWYHWKHFSFKNNLFSSQNISISVIIIGRNEASNLSKCINSILLNDYPKSLFEIIYIDDFSTDKSIEILSKIKSENFKYFELKEFIGDEKINNYKKTALRFAISKAKGEILLQTDADTWVGHNWISSHTNCYIDNEIDLVTGPVFFDSKNHILEQFQKYDFITTMGVTCAGISSKLHFMANGANMSYRKKIVDTFTNESKHASGDDMFLIQNTAINNPNSVSFLKNKNAIVYTIPEKKLSDFLSQRLRWASKTKSYKTQKLKLVILLVFFINFLLLLSFIAFPFINYKQQFSFVFMVVIKLIIDSLFILKISKFFNEEVSFKYLYLSLLLYPIYISYIGLTSIFITKYKWKNRFVE